MLQWHYCCNLSPFLADCPAPLVSSDSASVPVEASIEDLHDIQYEPSGQSVQADAKAESHSSALEEKLDQELQYHKHGSYKHKSHSEATNCHLHNSSDVFQRSIYASNYAVSEQDRLSHLSSVHSWTKAEPMQLISQEETNARPTSDICQSMKSSTPSPLHLPTSASTPSLPQLNQQHPHSHFDRQRSWPTYPVSDTPAPEISTGSLLAPSNSRLLQDPGAHTNFCAK